MTKKAKEVDFEVIKQRLNGYIYTNVSYDGSYYYTDTGKILNFLLNGLEDCLIKSEKIEGTKKIVGPIKEDILSRYLSKINVYLFNYIQKHCSPISDMQDAVRRIYSLENSYCNYKKKFNLEDGKFASELEKLIGKVTAELNKRVTDYISEGKEYEHFYFKENPVKDVYNVLSYLINDFSNALKMEQFEIAKYNEIFARWEKELSNYLNVFFENNIIVPLDVLDEIDHIKDLWNQILAKFGVKEDCRFIETLEKIGENIKQHNNKVEESPTTVQSVEQKMESYFKRIENYKRDYGIRKCRETIIGTMFKIIFKIFLENSEKLSNFDEIRKIVFQCLNELQICMHSFIDDNIPLKEEYVEKILKVRNLYLNSGIKDEGIEEIFSRISKGLNIEYEPAQEKEKSPSFDVSKIISVLDRSLPKPDVIIEDRKIKIILSGLSKILEESKSIEEVDFSLDTLNKYLEIISKFIDQHKNNGISIDQKLIDLVIKLSKSFDACKNKFKLESTSFAENLSKIASLVESPELKISILEKRVGILESELEKLQGEINNQTEDFEGQKKNLTSEIDGLKKALKQEKEKSANHETLLASYNALLSKVTNLETDLRTMSEISRKNKEQEGRISNLEARLSTAEIKLETSEKLTKLCGILEKKFLQLRPGTKLSLEKIYSELGSSYDINLITQALSLVNRYLRIKSDEIVYPEVYGICPMPKKEATTFKFTSNKDEVKVLFRSDFHLIKFDDKARRIIDSQIEFIEQNGVDVLVDLGDFWDMPDDVTFPEQRNECEEAKAYLKNIKIPQLYIAGNHIDKALSKGYNPTELMIEQVPNTFYLGHEEAQLILPRDIRLGLFHGTTYNNAEMKDRIDGEQRVVDAYYKAHPEKDKSIYYNVVGHTHSSFFKPSSRLIGIPKCSSTAVTSGLTNIIFYPSKSSSEIQFLGFDKGKSLRTISTTIDEGYAKILK